MKEIAVYEAKTRLSDLLAQVEQGEQITITRHGVAVARLVAVTPTRKSGAESQRRRVATVLAALKERRKGVTLDLPVREAIESGRA
ncbi:MAG: type II toxin-antitoxin system Phd/YefM family antitoxin [Candidatus Binatia bacterium]